MDIPHIPVLLEEVVSVFKGVNDGVIVDCTLGFGGHSYALLEKKNSISIIGFDKDTEALKFSKKRLKSYAYRVNFMHGAFSQSINAIEHTNIRGILADIGVSSWQLDDSKRGFGFESKKLDMRMDKSQQLSAYEVVNNYDQNALSEVLREYGEIQYHNDIAKKICLARKNKPIENAEQLVQIIGNKKEKKRKVSVATLVFQAIRIEVNDELEELAKLLDSIENSTINECVVAIISFHSLEDRIVKRTFKEWTKN